MKKIKILLVAMMLFSLVACGKAKNPSENVINSGNKAEFSMGEWKNNVYTNEFLNMKFNLPEGWNYASDEEIVQLMNLGSDILSGDKKYTDEVAKLTSAYYFFASDPNSGSSVSLFTEKPMIGVTMDYYLSQVKSQLEAVTEIKYEIGENSKQTIAGKEYTTLRVTAPEYEMIQKYYLRQMDDYFIGMIVTTQDETTIDQIISHFE